MASLRPSGGQSAPGPGQPAATGATACRSTSTGAGSTFSRPASASCWAQSSPQCWSPGSTTTTISALAFAFLMASMALVAMHHCNRNLLGLSVDATTEVDAFAGGEALLDFDAAQRLRASIAATSKFAAWAASECDSVAGGRKRDRLQGASRRAVEARRDAHRASSSCAPAIPSVGFTAWTYVQGALTVYVAPAPASAFARCRRGAHRAPASRLRIAGR